MRQLSELTSRSSTEAEDGKLEAGELRLHLHMHLISINEILTNVVGAFPATRKRVVVGV